MFDMRCQPQSTRSKKFARRSLRTLMTEVQQQKLKLVSVESERPSAFSANLLFSYIGNFIYDADAPLPA